MPGFLFSAYILQINLYTGYVWPFLFSSFFFFFFFFFFLISSRGLQSFRQPHSQCFDMHNYILSAGSHKQTTPLNNYLCLTRLK